MGGWFEASLYTFIPPTHYVTYPWEDAGGALDLAGPVQGVVVKKGMGHARTRHQETVVPQDQHVLLAFLGVEVGGWVVDGLGGGEREGFFHPPT